MIEPIYIMNEQRMHRLARVTTTLVQLCRFVVTDTQLTPTEQGDIFMFCPIILPSGLGLLTLAEKLN